MCAASLRWRHMVNAYEVHKRVGGRKNCVMSLTRAIPERIGSDLR